MALYTFQNKIYNEKGELQYGGANAPGGTYVTGVSSLEEIANLNKKYSSLGLDPSMETRALQEAESTKRNAAAETIRATGNNNITQEQIDQQLAGTYKAPVVDTNNKLPTETTEQWQARTRKAKLPIAGANSPAPVVPGATPATSPAPGAPTTPPPAVPTAFSGTNLIQGSNGPIVSQLQSALGIEADGKFGPKTLAAVKSYQVSHGLTPDGIVGPQTMAMLNKPQGDTGAAVASGIGAGAGGSASGTPGAKPEIPSTGNPAIDSLIGVLNNQSPQKTAVDIYKEIYSAMGLDNIKVAYNDNNKAFAELQEKKNDEAQDIKNNPWLSEGIKNSKLKQLDAKYETRELILTNKMKLQETQIDNGRADAQFIAGKTLDQLQQSGKLTQDIIMKAIDIVEKEAEAERKSASAGTDYKPPTSYQEWELAGKPGTYAQWLQEQNVKAPTSAQQTVATYATRIEQSNPIITKIGDKIAKMNIAQFEAEKKLPSYFQSDDYQAYDQASRNFINSVLRRESGAVISPSEFDNAYKQYLPRAGDSAQTLKQKKANRDVVQASFKKSAGSAYSSVDELLGTQGGNDPLGLGI